MLRAAFKLALRQAEGLMLSVVELLGGELAVPDHTTVSRGAARLESITRGPLPRGPLHVLIDSTGLKMYGAGQWQAEKHGRSRRSWRKLHPGVDARSGQIVAVTLTDQDAASNANLDPRNLSFKHTVQLWTQWVACGLSATYDSGRLFALIAQCQVGHRPGRIEPRMRKRRPKPFPWLKTPRPHARRQVQRYGHDWATK